MGTRKETHLEAVKDEEERREGPKDRRETSIPDHAETFAPVISDRVAYALRGVRFILLYLAILGTIAFVATLIHWGGPF